MIEQANSVLKKKIAAWESDHQSTQWTQAIPEVILAMNSQRHSTTHQPPYEIVFNLQIMSQRVVFHERDIQEVLDEPILDIIPTLLSNISTTIIDPNLCVPTNDTQITFRSSGKLIPQDVLQYNIAYA